MNACCDVAQELLLVGDPSMHSDMKGYMGHVESLLERKSSLIAGLKGKLRAFRPGK